MQFITNNLIEIEDNMFIETAEYSGNLYGTSKFAIESVISENKVDNLFHNLVCL
jgi:guanylate kinase